LPIRLSHRPPQFLAFQAGPFLLTLDPRMPHKTGLLAPAKRQGDSYNCLDNGFTVLAEKHEEPMAKSKVTQNRTQQIRGSGTDAVEAALAERAGARFEWHFGRVTRMGSYEAAGDRGVTIVWEEGAVSSQQGSISDEEWEIFKLAFLTTGRVAVLSDQEGDGWMYDYRFLEAVR
jgi:hypothetical protein